MRDTLGPYAWQCQLAENDAAREKGIDVEGSIWGAVVSATLNLLLINETGYLLSRKETLVARGSPARYLTDAATPDV